MAFSQRIAILVDSENLEHSVSEHFVPERGLRKTHVAYPNWKVIVPYVSDKRTIVRNIYYKKKGLRVSKKFRNMWERELYGEIKQPIKSVDPYIIVDAITLCDKVDVVMLLAGDKDYLPLIWFLRSKGCKAEMAAFADAAAREIIEAADSFYTLREEHTIVVRRSRS